MITAGQSFLHFRIEQKLGEGGMGVVWKATDTSLGRSVAIKVLPQEFAADPERLARFEREARMLATLNHPNIATVFSVHAEGDERCLAMEMVPGEDLSERIARGPLPVPEALEIARQIALALEAAHEHGVVHRDLKPANVRLTPDGRVKVLDFGLAKAMEGAAPSSALSQSPTMAGSVMGSGAIIGTAAYMSPEQARGQAADRRADIWAFGVVLFEMLSGHRAFEGDTVSDILASVLKSEPDRARLPQAVPARIRRLLDRCLEKSPRARLRDIGEALLAIEDELAGKADPAAAVAEAATPRRGATRRERLLWAVGLAGAVALTLVLGALLRRAPAEAPTRKFALVLADGDDRVVEPSISPDGTKIAYLVGDRLWVRDLRHSTKRELATSVMDPFRPAWSPDGQAIAFASRGALSRVLVSSGEVSPICTVDDFSGGSGGSWGEDGRIYFTKGHDHIYVVPASGGVPAVFLARADSVDQDLHHPFVLPGKRGVLYARHIQGEGARVISVAHDGVRRDLVRIESAYIWSPVYDRRGFIVYSRVGEGTGIWAVPFSIDRLQVTGEPFLVMANVVAASVSDRGEMVYLEQTGGLQSSVVRVDRTGRVLARLTEPIANAWSLALSPDETRLAVETRVAGEGDLWVCDLVRPLQARFAFGPGRQGEADWSPDGRNLVWCEIMDDSLMIRPVDGSSPPRSITYGFMARYTPDGRHILFARSTSNSTDIILRAVGSASDSLPLADTPADERYPVPHPRSPFFAFTSDESGQPEVYLRRYPGGTGRWQVSSGRSTTPQWSRRGDRLYYRQDDVIYEVSIALEPEVRIGTPQRLFDLKALGLQADGRYSFVTTSNPDQFLAFRRAEGDQPTSDADAMFVENWAAEFRRK